MGQSAVVRAGGWLFRRRTSIPLPLALALLFIPGDTTAETRFVFAAGAAIVAAGETLRLWAVRHIGVISRTRSERLGPLISTGPFGFVRNPLYLGNIALWVGFAVSAHLLWLVPIFVIILTLEYHAIVRWEEELLAERRGDEYRAYAARVPRWLPSLLARRRGNDHQATTNSWRDTFFSERGTLIAIAVGYLLLWMKSGMAN
jgi:protein-S-isoprenylcysteine O-methyltransferase Ste14